MPHINRQTPLFSLLFAVLLSILMLAADCNGHQSAAWKTMDGAERLMDTAPDSAFDVLNHLSPAHLNGKEEAARYALLKSMALDKNWIDTTTFDVLQPAIDYYLKHGSADEKLRTLYYQGRIYQNKSDYNMAMQTFLRANDLKDDIVDTLVFANLLVAQGNLYFNSFQINDYINNNLIASDLYGRIGNVNYEFSSLLKALDGAIINNDRQKADSILKVAGTLTGNRSRYDDLMKQVKLTYNIRFGSKQMIEKILSEQANLPDISDDLKLDLCIGYLQQGDKETARILFDAIDGDSFIRHSPKYLSVKTDVLEAFGDYQGALHTFKNYVSAAEKEKNRIYSQKTAVAQDLHNIRIENIYEIQKKNKLIWLCLCGVLILVAVIGFTYYHLRNAKLECERQKLESENLQHRIAQLEDESENLKELLEKRELSKPITDIIKERIGILNGLLAAQITDNASYSKPYDDWISKITEDRNFFMNSTRMAFKASHSKFIQYLEEHGLDESEMNYICLYAIGLRGKEVGEYMQLKRHYHISSEIRRKLGLSEHETNLGIYIRDLMNNF